MIKKTDSLKNIKKPVKAQTVPAKTKGNGLSGINIAALVIVLLYALTEFIPQFDTSDAMGVQWLYISVLNCFTTLYLLIYKKFIPNSFFKSALFLLYSGFVLIAGLSFFVSYNIIESLVTYARLIVGFIAFLNLLSIIRDNSKILRHLFLILGLVVLYQSIYVLIEFISNNHHFANMDDLILSIKANAGNKNALAASIVIKIPFIIYAIYNTGFFGRMLYLTTFFLSCLALFILNARASFVSLFLEVLVYLILVAIFYFKNKRNAEVFKNPALLTGILIVSIVITQILFSSIEKRMVKGSYGDITQRVETIELSNEAGSNRFTYWNYAVDFIKTHPLTGGGYGNWKIHSIPYEKYIRDQFIISKHVHNDFLEMTADTGILGGMVYGGIFLCLFIYSLITLFSVSISLENKIVIATVLMALIAYTVDAIFNFPLERANIQVLLALIIALSGFGFHLKQKDKNSKSNDNIHKSIVLIFIVISLATVYFNYNVFKSMELQDKTWHDWTGVSGSQYNFLQNNKLRYKSDQINSGFPSIPNITSAAMPIACIKAKYLYNEKKYSEALDVLNADKKSNPYLYVIEYIRSVIAEKLNQPDSAYYYAKTAFYNRPSNIIYFKYLNDMAARRKDSLEVEKSFKEITRWMPSPGLWYDYSQNMSACTNNSTPVLTALSEGLKKYPNDTLLLFQYNFLEGLSLFNKKMYDQSITSFKASLKYREDVSSIQNIGMAYFNLGVYSEAIPYYTDLINQKLYSNGQSEFFRGICYSRTGQNDKACSDLIAAKAMGYSVDASLMEGCR